MSESGNKAPSLCELSAATGNNPWRCSQCGYQIWVVIDTYTLASGARRRIRVCRNCGRTGPRVYTTEVVERVEGGTKG